ncbi:hypothetical protein [Cohnella yongneupensis]|uniref:Uncharacterized protein n=1 Tax=Cohnella yongneupensis TaxID=425006 RepID=A0ABW0QWB6_9BACL
MSDTLRNKVVITRKEHACFGCAIKYPAGTSMHAVTTADGGKIETTYWCDTCQTYWERNMTTGDEISFGELRTEDREGWEAINKEVNP